MALTLQIDDDLASVVVAQLLFLESEGAAPINMYINSPGGSVTAGLAIYDTMQYVRPTVATMCIGQACSMGSLLLTAGAKGHRASLPNARIMVHQPSGGAYGTASDVAIHAEEILSIKKNITGLYGKHTGQPTEVIERALERDKFMSASEALVFGLVDVVMTKRT